MQSYDNGNMFYAAYIESVTLHPAKFVLATLNL